LKSAVHIPIIRGFDNNTLKGLIQQYEQDSPARRVLGLYSGFGETCPVRLRINTYRGCAFACQFCYVWDRPEAVRVRPDRRILKQLERDISDYLEYGLPPQAVMVSCSTDPLQPLEDKHHTTLKAATLLAEHEFPLIMMSQNPGQLLKPEYRHLIDSASMILEVSIASMHAGQNGSGIFKSSAPPSLERFEAIKELRKLGMNIRLRVDPLIPRVGNEGPGQTKEDIEEVVKRGADAGIDLVISKCLRLTPDIPKPVKLQLQQFYRQNAFEWQDELPFMDLEVNIQNELMGQVRGACVQNGVSFCTCTSNVMFNGVTHCSVGGWGNNGYDSD